MENIEIRKYKSEDLNEVIELIIESINGIEEKFYNKLQKEAWIKNISKNKLGKTFLANYSLVGTIDESIVGIVDITENNYINMLYVKPSFQNKGIASLLLKNVEEYALSRKGDIRVDASEKAKSFFINHGYKQVSKNEVIRSEISLNNYTMVKIKN